MGLFSRAGYEPLMICGKGHVQLMNLGMSKRDVQYGTEIIEDLAHYNDDDYARLFMQQAETIKIVQSVLTETSEPDEANLIAHLFAEGWFVGCLETIGGRSRHGKSSHGAQFALTLLKQGASEANWGRNAVEAGYFAQRSGAPAEMFWTYLNEGAVFTG